jgi:NNP family nitrate/nitrite transporter-like MFS transporter
MAFFLSFVVWFDMAPFAPAIQGDLGLTDAQMVTLALCNLALTVPARVLVGVALDRYGPRRLFGALLVGAAIPNTVFAMSSSFSVLVASRLALGVVGAGFVVGIRMVSSWFDPEELGTAEGVYGGWGNFGSAAAALALPAIAALVAGGDSAWRWGVGGAGLVAAAYGVVYWRSAQDHPSGVEAAHRRRSKGALAVPTRGAVWGLVALQVPVAGALGIVAWRVEAVGVLSPGGLAIALAGVAAYFVWQVTLVLRTNADVRAGAVSAEPYAFRAVVLLSLAYGVTFGAELAVVSLLPTFFADTFGLEIGAASAAGSAFAFTNLVTRPGGGLISDVTGRRRRWVRVALVGTSASFGLMALLGPGWPLPVGIGVVALASVFVQGGNGAVFAMVPLVHERSSGPIAGLAGSYGNIGGIAFSSILFLTHNDPKVLFLVVAGAGLAVAGLCRWLPETAAARAGVPVGPVASSPRLARPEPAVV